ncbi:hypothetical protein NDU88_008512 [Pleurodeles waltl]|uniref:Uncharacterized protein n=1 Tax=Pleurodeles waltl TaxID=8319 RepID=A0AAV7N8N1_PLEWA|nr:hypothetical protein NDU88_008512 [Pleurodeles waltl]
MTELQQKQPSLGDLSLTSGEGNPKETEEDQEEPSNAEESFAKLKKEVFYEGTKGRETKVAPQTLTGTAIKLSDVKSSEATSMPKASVLEVVRGNLDAEGFGPQSRQRQPQCRRLRSSKTSEATSMPKASVTERDRKGTH